MKVVFLIGFMGSGKTTVGKALSNILNWPFLDTDEMIVNQMQMPVTQIFAQYGEPYFRDLETQLLRDLEARNIWIVTPTADQPGGHTGSAADQKADHADPEADRNADHADSAAGQSADHADPAADQPEDYAESLHTADLPAGVAQEEGVVISVGGGMPVREENRVLMAKIGTVVYLKSSEETLIKRLSGDTSRPLLKGGNLQERIRTLMEQRGSIYTQAATIQIFTDDMSVWETARSIARHVLGHGEQGSIDSGTK